MSKKADQRGEKRAEQMERFEASRAKTVARVIVVKVPTIAEGINAAIRNTPKAGASIPSIEDLKTPKAVKDGSYFAHQMAWCFTKKDVEGDWSWKEPREWSTSEWDELILPKMTEFAKLTWAYIDTFSSEGGHKMHHTQAIDQISAEAQSRWLKLGLEQFDTLFRFRLGGARRIWGVRLQAHFFMVWSERNHRIAPTKKNRK